MDSIYGSIEISSIISIQRSDGRIHSAKVVRLISESKSVLVEWNEGDEVKGKDISLDLVFQLNPQLRSHLPSKVSSLTRTTSSIVLNPSDSFSTKPLILDFDAVEREFDSRPPPTLPSHFAPRFISNLDSVKPFDGTITNRSELKTSESPNGTLKLTNGRSIRRPTIRTLSFSSGSSSTPALNNKTERRFVRPHIVRQPTISVMSDAIETPSSMDLYGPFGQMIFDYRSTLNFTPMKNDDLRHPLPFEQKDLRICVAIRKRPLNKREIAKRDNDVITIPTKNLCLVHVPRVKVDLTKFLDHHQFKFDYTFDEHVSTDLVYRYTAAPLIDTIFQGGNATVFAYGQTGSGKTFTMGGDLSLPKTDYSHGIYAQTTRDIFDRLSLPEYSSSIEIFVTFYEIYCGKIFDLLNNKKRLRVLEDEHGLVQVCDKKEEKVTSVDDVLNIIQEGMNIRTSGTTGANATSSRSHAVLQLILKTSTSVVVSSRLPSFLLRNRKQVATPRLVFKEIGKMSLIDLAGSERGKDTASGDRLQRMEGSEINKSLLALKECIRALGRGEGNHVPFRGSTLTKVLRDSFIGEKSKVCMIAMVSPTHSDVENTINTLRYADRVKELRAGDNDEDEKSNDLEPEDATIDNENDDENPDGSVVFSNDVEETSITDTSQMEHFLECEETLLNTCQNLLNEKEPMLNQQLQTILNQAQDKADYDHDKFVNEIRENLSERHRILDELRKHLDLFANCLYQE